MRIAILPGSFDPIQTGHIKIALNLIRELELDKLYFLVEPRPRRRQGVKSVKHRDNMVRLAIQSQPKIGSIIIDNARFTISESWPKLHERFKGSVIYLVLNNKNLSYMIEWPQDNGLDKMAPTFVINTDVDVADDMQSKVSVISQTKAMKLDFRILSICDRTENARSLRHKIRKGQISSEINPSVLSYINDNGLYKPL